MHIKTYSDGVAVVSRGAESDNVRAFLRSDEYTVQFDQQYRGLSP